MFTNRAAFTPGASILQPMIFVFTKPNGLSMSFSFEQGNRSLMLYSC